MTVITALGLGLLIGAKHAFEPDHLAAVGTMLPDASSARRAAARGAWWGLGHGGAIAAIGLPLVLLDLRVPEHLEALAEVVVAVMLVWLGARAWWRSGSARRAGDPHAPAARRPLSIGLVHGLAGSGAAVVLATAGAPSQASASAFLLLFVVGSTLSMTAVAGALAAPLGGLGADRTPWLLRACGALSIGVGLWWGAPHAAGWLG